MDRVLILTVSQHTDDTNEWAGDYIEVMEGDVSHFDGTATRDEDEVFVRSEAAERAAEILLEAGIRWPRVGLHRKEIAQDVAAAACRALEARGFARTVLPLTCSSDGPFEIILEVVSHVDLRGVERVTVGRDPIIGKVRTTVWDEMGEARSYDGDRRPDLPRWVPVALTSIEPGVLDR